MGKKRKMEKDRGKQRLGLKSPEIALMRECLLIRLLAA